MFDDHPVLIRRGAIRRNGMNGMDVTVKSALGRARCFAPTWDMVLGSKRGEISWDQYTAQYLSILDSLDEQEWVWLHDQADHGLLTVLCYCPLTKEKCHTALIVDYACENYPALFVRYPEEDAQ